MRIPFILVLASALYSCSSNRSVVQSDNKAASTPSPQEMSGDQVEVMVVEEIVMDTEQVRPSETSAYFSFTPIKSIRFNHAYEVSARINDSYDYYRKKNDPNRYTSQGVVDKNGTVILPHLFTPVTFLSNDELVLSINHKAYGLFNLNEKRWTIPLEYNELLYLGNNVLGAKKDNKWGIIDNNNQLLTPFTWDKMDKLSGIDNYVMVSSGETWGIYSVIERKLTVPIEYSRLRKLDRESAFLVIHGTKSNIVDISNKPLFKKWYDEIRTSSINPEYFIVRENGRYGIVDRNEKVIVPITYLEFSESNYSDGSYLARNKDGKYGFIMIDGRITLPFNYDNVKKGYYNNIISIQNGKCGLVKVNNGMPTEILTCDFDNITQTSKTFIVEKGGKFGILNQFGKALTEIEYTKLEALTDRDNDPALYHATKGKDIVLLNEHGRVISESGFREVAPLHRSKRESYYAPGFNYLKVRGKNGKWGLIDKLGKMVMEPSFDNIESENDNILVVKSKSKCGMYSLLSQKQLVEFKYDNIIWSTSHYLGFAENEIDFISIKSDQVTIMSSTETGR